jgi:hypothetical protein
MPEVYARRMVLELIRELNKAVPFRPYRLRLVGGVTHRVPHPDFIAIAPRGTWVMVSDEHDHPYWISTILIEEVTPLKSGSKNGKHKRRS